MAIAKIYLPKDSTVDSAQFTHNDLMVDGNHIEKPSTGSLDEKEPEVANSEAYIDPIAEKRLIRKLDLMLSPMMVMVFLVAYLDRSNIGWRT